MSVSLTTGQNGLPTLVLVHPEGSTAEVYLHGAHVASWKPAGGSEALFLSPTAQFAPDTAIRGGIPVIFPQFADLGPLPKHGFARTQAWEWTELDEATPLAVLRLVDTEATRALWPHPFRAELGVKLEAQCLSLSLTIENTGDAPFTFTTALHTYLRVADVGKTAVAGLATTPYRNRGSEEMHRDEPGDLWIEGEVDRLYLGAPRDLYVRDEAGGRRFHLRAEGFADAVVWNPGPELAAALPDLEDEAYREMLCVEAAQVGEPVTLEPNEAWQGKQEIEVMTEADKAP